jgi:hypothetical protein
MRNQHFYLPGTEVTYHVSAYEILYINFYNMLSKTSEQTASCMMLYRVQILCNVELDAEMSTDAKSTGQFEHATPASPEGLRQINKITEESWCFASCFVIGQYGNCPKMAFLTVEQYYDHK